MKRIITAVLGGSGFYDFEGLEKRKERKIDTPFGPPSAPVVTGTLDGQEMVFLARHGIGHTILPHEINYRANIYALKTLGVDRVLAPTAVGSLKENIRPLDFVITDQFYDRTRNRRCTFFGNGVAAHISFADPVCGKLSDLVYKKASESLSCGVHLGGTYVCIEGPQFSTRSESEVYRKMGFDIIGMTALTEAKLAREAEMCYSNIALVTDYDCWFEEEVSIEQVLSNMNRNTENVKVLIRKVISSLNEAEECSCRNALAASIITPRERIPEETFEMLKPVIGKYFT